jgi:hypothetical protein
LGGQQEFPRGLLPAGIVPWTFSGDFHRPLPLTAARRRPR